MFLNSTHIMVVNTQSDNELCLCVLINVLRKWKFSLVINVFSFITQSDLMNSFNAEKF